MGVNITELIFDESEHLSSAWKYFYIFQLILVTPVASGALVDIGMKVRFNWINITNHRNQTCAKLHSLMQLPAPSFWIILLNKCHICHISSQSILLGLSRYNEKNQQWGRFIVYFQHGHHERQALIKPALTESWPSLQSFKMHGEKRFLNWKSDKF